MTNKILNKIVRDMQSFSDAILIVGSSAWNGTDNSSDIDFDVIVSDYNSLTHIDVSEFLSSEFSLIFNSFKDNHLEHVLTLEIPIFSLKIFNQENKISIHFIQKQAFLNICNFNLDLIHHSWSLLNLRTTKTAGFDNQRSFSGSKIHYRCLSFTKSGYQLIEAPVAIIDKVGRFCPGQVIDRFISFPKLIYDKNINAEKHLKNLRVNLVKRILYENSINLHNDEAHLDLCLCRKDRIPNNLLQKLRNEEYKIKKTQLKLENVEE